MTGRARALSLLLVCLCACLPACSSVAPWERGRLAVPQMALEPHPVQRALRAHTYTSREAAFAGEAGHGGGCGCY